MIYVLDYGVHIFAFCGAIDEIYDKSSLLHDMIFYNMKGVEFTP